MTDQAASAARPSTSSTTPAASAVVHAERRSETRDAAGYIHVVNWEKFQHYKTGPHSKQASMAWIRCYTELLDSDEYLDLPARDRALLHAVWMATGLLGNGRCPASVRSMKRRFRLRYVQLDRLIHAGFIEVRSSKASRAEQSREEENPAIEGLGEPKVDATRPSEPGDAESPGDGSAFDYAAVRLLEACQAPVDGSERIKLLGLWAGGATIGAIESARERVLTKQGPITNPFGLAVAVIRAESPRLAEVSG